MIARFTSKVAVITAAAMFACGLITSAVFAGTNGTWTATSGTLLWNDTNNWATGTVADGADGIADFSTLDIVSDITVHLNTARTIGSLVFADLTPSNNWIVDNNGTAANALTLSTTVAGTIPAITVNNQSATLTAALVDTQGFTKNGTGTLVLQNSSDSFGSPIVLNGGTLTIAAEMDGLNSTNALPSLQFGTVPAGTGTGSTVISAVNINANVTATSLVAQTSLTGNTISIASGKTLTINGPVTIGYDPTSATAAHSTSLIISGADATSKLITGGAGQILSIGNPASSAPAQNITATLDLHGLNSFSFTGTTANIGFNNRSNGTLILANSFSAPSNTITVTTLNMGGGNGNSNGGATDLLTFGSGTNTLKADTINVGIAKSNATMNFPSGSSGASLNIAGNSGARAAINIGVDTTANTSGSQTGTVDFTTNGTHIVNILASTITLGQRSGTSTSTNSGNSTGILSFNAGTIDTNNLVMAVRTNSTLNTTQGEGIGTINISGTGAMVISGGAATFTIARNNLADTAASPNNLGAVGTVNLNGGSLQSNADILVDTTTLISGGGNNPYSATVNVNGGTLNLQDSLVPTTQHNIGTALLPVTLNAVSGTIQGLGGVNGTVAGGSSGGSNLTPTTVAINKTGTGILTLAGLNTYAGDTVVSAANTASGLVVSGSLPAAGNVIVNTGALGGTGNGTTTGVMGNVTLNGGGIINPGASFATGQVGTLTMTSLTDSGGTLAVDFTSGANDLIKVGSAGANFSGGQITLGTIPQPGTYTLVSSTTGIMSGTKPSAPTIANTRATFATQFSGDLHSLQLVVSGNAHNLTWTGSNGSAWDVGASGTQNWSNSGSTSTANDTFFNLDSVTFTDTPSAPANRNITLGIQVLPLLVTVNNGVGNDYSVSGNGDISGTGSINKSGAGNFVLGTANTYTGNTVVNGGSLILTSTGGIASTASITIGASGTLQLGNGDATANTGSGGVSGATLGLGNSTASAPVIANNGNFVVNTTVGTMSATGSNSTAVPVFNAISGNGNVSVTGTGVVKLSGSNSYLGTTTIGAGATLQINDLTSLGSSSGGNVTVASGGTLDFEGLGNNVATLGTKTFSIAGTGVGGFGAIFLTSSEQQQNLIQNLALTADASINPGGRMDVNGGTLNLGTGVVGGVQPGNTLTTLGGQLGITAATVTDGNINITVGAGTSGRLNLGVGSVIQGNGTITFAAGTSALFSGGNAAGTITRPMVWAGSTMGVNTANATTINSPISLQGNLTVTPVVTAAAGALTLAGNITQDSTPRSVTITSNNTGFGSNPSVVSTVILSGNNTFSGGVFIGTDNPDNSILLAPAILQLGSPGALNSTGVNAVTFSSASVNTTGLRLAGNSVTIAGLNTLNLSTPFVENASAAPATLTVNTTGANNFSGTLQDGAGTGPLSFTVTGTGSMTLSGQSTNTGAISVAGGSTLILTSSSGLATNSLNVQNGTLTLGTSGISANTNLTLGDASNHSGLVDTAGTSFQLAALNTVGTSSSNIITNTGPNSTTLTVEGGTSAFGGIIKNNTGATGNGAGTIALHVGNSLPTSLTLNGASTYTAGTSINSNATLIIGGPGSIAGDVSVNSGGTFIVNGTVAITSNVTVQSNGTLAGTGNAGNVNINGGTVTPGSFIGTLNMRSLTSNGGIVNYDLSATDSGNHDKVVVSGTATFNGITLTPNKPGSLAVGTYTLMTYASRAGDPGSVVLGVPANTRANYHLTVGTTAITIAPDATPLNLTWVGAANGATWDVGSSGTLNWSNSGSATSANDRFFNLDTVNFTDGSSNRTVNISSAADIKPSVINVTNNSGTYTFKGAGSIADATTSLNMTGSGTLVLDTINTYASGTTLTGGGTIQLGDGTNTNSGGSLGVGPVTGSAAGGKLVADYPGSLSVNNSISGPISLTVLAGSNVNLGGTNTYTGSTTIKNGTVSVGAPGGYASGSILTLGDASNTPSTTNQLSLNSGNATVGGVVALGSGTNVINGGGNFIFAGGTNTVPGVVQNGTSTFTGSIQSNGLTVHSGTLILTAANGPGGVTTDAGGTLQIGNGTTVGSLILTPTAGTYGTVISGAITSNGTVAFDRSDNIDLSTSGIGGTGGLTQLGSGKLTLGLNSYAGPTVISGNGTMVTTSTSSLGAVPGGSVTINAGSTLDLGGDTTLTPIANTNPVQNTGSLVFGAKPFFIAGSGTSNSGAIENSVLSTQETAGALQNVTLTADATINAVGRIDIRGGSPSLDLAGHTLTLIGGNQFSYFSGSVTDGNFDVQAGTLAFESSATVAGGGTGKITLESGSRLLLNNDSNVSRPVQVNGSAILLASSNASTLASNINLSAGVANGNPVAGSLNFANFTAPGGMTVTGNITQTTPSSVTVNSAFSTTDSNNVTTVTNAPVVLAGTNSYSGPTTVTSGILQLGVNNAVPTTSRLVMNGGIFNTGGFNEQTGTLQTLASSTLDMSTVNSGAATNEVLQFADSSLAHWRYSSPASPTVSLSIANWNPTFDQIVFPSATSLNGNELSQIQFTGSGQNYAALQSIATGPNAGKFQLVPSNTLPTGIMTLGDVNQDGTVNVQDLSALMSALSDLKGYQNGTADYSGTATPIRTTGGVWNASQLIYVADLNLDGSVDNRDIQALITYLANGLAGGGGAGSVNAVPEPASVVLLGIGGSLLCLAAARRRKTNRVA